MPQRNVLCCFPCDDNTADRSLLKSSWFHKVAGSNPRAQDQNSVKWWRHGWKRIRQTGECCESLVEDFLRLKWKRFLRKCRDGGKFFCKSKPGRFHYDRVSYELNFDQEFRDFGDHKNEGLSKASNENGAKFAQRTNE